MHMTFNSKAINTSDFDSSLEHSIVGRDIEVNPLIMFGIQEMYTYENISTECNLLKDDTVR